MPFVSKAQQRYLFATKPAIAKEFAAATTNYKSLPEHVAAVRRLSGVRKRRSMEGK